jgi:putative tryptophan/tyrosine transport system permease protein
MDFLLTAIIQGLAFSGLALGIFLSLRIFRLPDITTDGSYTTGGIITALLLSMGWHPLFILPICIGGGMLAGWTTGYVHTKLKVNPLLAGILVMTALYSINLLLLGRPNLPVDTNNTLFYGFVNSTQNIFLVMLTIAVILIASLYYLLRTDFGIAMRATGENDTMARAQGIHTERMKRTGLAIANALTAASGYLMVQYQGFADINMGIGIVISGLAAVMIGESLPGRKSILLILILVCTGSVLFRLLLAAALAAGLDPAYLKLITAVLVLLIVALNRKNTLQA